MLESRNDGLTVPAGVRTAGAQNNTTVRLDRRRQLLIHCFVRPRLVEQNIENHRLGMAGDQLIQQSDVQSTIPRPLHRLMQPRSGFITALAVVAGATVILADPIFQGLAIALMAGSLVSMFTAPVLVPLLYFMAHNRKASVKTSKN